MSDTKKYVLTYSAVDGKKHVTLEVEAFAKICEMAGITYSPNFTSPYGTNFTYDPPLPDPVKISPYDMHAILSDPSSNKLEDVIVHEDRTVTFKGTRYLQTTTVQPQTEEGKKLLEELEARR